VAIYSARCKYFCARAFRQFAIICERSLLPPITDDVRYIDVSRNSISNRPRQSASANSSVVTSLPKRRPTLTNGSVMIRRDLDPGACPPNSPQDIGKHSRLRRQQSIMLSPAYNSSTIVAQSCAF
jgi:hypothetical protein